MSHNSTTTTTFSINDSNVSAATKEKRKNRWGILGRKKNTDKQKSATLGREKSKNKEKVELTKQDVNLRHRWSTGVSRLQPLSATFSKDKLVSGFYKNFSETKIEPPLVYSTAIFIQITLRKVLKDIIIRVMSVVLSTLFLGCCNNFKRFFPTSFIYFTNPSNNFIFYIFF